MNNRNVMMIIWKLDYLGLFIALLLALLILPAVASESNVDIIELDVFGRTFPTDSLEQRVTRLERKLRVPHLKESTMTYRLAMLHDVQRTTLSKDHLQAAVKSYNRGVQLEQEGKLDEAVASYKTALSQYPGMLRAANNLAHLYTQRQNYRQAAGVYEQAIERSPKEPMLYRNLGVVYHQMGDIKSALSAYRSYLKYAPQPDPAIEAMVANVDSDRMAGENITDYSHRATEASQGRLLTWPTQFNPINFYVDFDDPNQTAFIKQIHEGMRAWEKATNGRIRFREVPARGQARISILLKPGPLQHPSVGVGETQFVLSEDHHRNMAALKMDIIVNTGEPGGSISPGQRQKQVRRLVLHEIGHAIGIWGHSPHPDDIMYAHPIVDTLSKRDVKTIRKLYQMDKVSRN